jgi:FlaA1/EpsC-like NDP-sugar epimerase
MNKALRSILYLILNLFVWTCAGFFALLFRYDFSIPLNIFVKVIPSILILILTFYLISYLDNRLFGIPSKTSIEEFFSIIRRYLSTGILYFVFLYFYPNFILPRSFPVLTSVLALGFFVISNKTIKYTYQKLSIRDNKISVGIYGAGQQGQLLIQKILKEGDLDWKPVVVLDDDVSIKINRLNGVKVVTGIPINHFLQRNNLQILIVSFSQISNEKLQTIQDACDNHGVQLRIISPIKAITGAAFSISDIRKPTQEELIGKSSIKTNFQFIKSYFEGKIILITGAGGSIGSEIARQISNCLPKDLYLLDRDESGLLDLDISLESQKLNIKKHLVLADIRDGECISKILTDIKPEIVFHAAALKHLNMLEMYPEEGYKTNVQGTNNLLTAAVNSQVKTFINISTDKAADPISILGKTKLIAEQLTAGYAEINRSYKYVSVRFGNVFGSRGSVMQTFSKQIELGAAITITDPKVQRYFMTLEDSVHLVLQAAIQGESGDTLILKMGEPILIKDIATKLIKASGKKIEVKYSSLRPGEKLSELLIGKDEKTLNSLGGEILRVRVNPITWTDVSKVWKNH